MNKKLLMILLCSRLVSTRALSTCALDQAVLRQPELPPPPQKQQQQQQLKDAVGLSQEAWVSVLRETPFKTYHAEYLANHVSNGRIKNWDDARALPKALRDWLGENYRIDHGRVVRRLESSDGTVKMLVELNPGKSVECVLIPIGDRKTLCVSSQIGCALNCTFCHTGTMKFGGNLSAAEILKQFTALAPEDRAQVSNFVFMGQGEPLYNYKSVKGAIDVLTCRKGLNFGHGKISLSTSGIVPLIPQVASEMGVLLAISLHAPTNEIRSRIMSINKTYPIELLMEACRKFSDLASSATRRITFEYVMLDGINDDPNLHAKQLAQLLKPLDSHVNLIPFNPWPASPYRRSPAERIALFSQTLRDQNVFTTIRRSRGDDILAACGQLKSSSEAGKTSRPARVPIPNN